MKLTNNSLALKKSKLITIFASSLIMILTGSFLLPNTAFLSDINAQNIIDMTNKNRAALDIAPLFKNELLTQAARSKALAIFEAQQFRHDPDGKSFSNWIKESGYSYSYVGENLAMDFVTTEGALKAWLASPTHKKNLLNTRFKEIGVAVVEGKLSGKETTLIVQIFGTPLTSIATGLDASPSYYKNIDLFVSNEQFSNASAEKTLLNSILPPTRNYIHPPMESRGRPQTALMAKMDKFKIADRKLYPEKLSAVYYLLILSSLSLFALKTSHNIKALYALRK